MGYLFWRKRNTVKKLKIKTKTREMFQRDKGDTLIKEGRTSEDVE
jgi:hypothetical protein